MFVRLCIEVPSIELKFYSLSILPVEFDVAVKFCHICSLLGIFLCNNKPYLGVGETILS